MEHRASESQVGAQGNFFPAPPGDTPSIRWVGVAHKLGWAGLVAQGQL